MRAVRHHTHGGPDALQVEELPVPEPRAGEALVQVAACAVNHLDVLQRRGPALIPGFALPHTPGMDVAGTVTALGPATDGPQPGERVLVNPAVPCGSCPTCLAGHDGLCPVTAVIGGTVPGGYADYVLVPVANLHRVPDEVSLVAAAAVPTVWMTAWHALHVTGSVQAGETVLIHAGASGVSTAAVQLARAAGARVISTVSAPGKADYVLGLGADLVLDSTAPDLVGQVRAATEGRGVDVVLDHVGPATWDTSVYSLAPRGRLVFFGNTTGNQVGFDLVYAYHFGLQLLGSDPYDMREFGAMLDSYWASGFSTPIDTELPLADARIAHERLEARQVTGKIVLRP